MLKLLLGHWQSHREPLPFVLTDDPLYCAHLAASSSRPFPEVYSVNRVNPIFEEDEPPCPAHTEQAPPTNSHFRTFPTKRKPPKTKDIRQDPQTSNFVLRKPATKTASNALEYTSRGRPGPYDSIGDETTRPHPLRRSSSEETETKSSDDTGYSSGGRPKSLSVSDGSLADQPMSSDSDDCPRPEAVVVVSADVHRTSTPEDVLVRSPSSESSANYSYRSYGSSPEPFDSLTMSSSSSSKGRRTHSGVKDRLQKLLEKGNEARRTAEDLDMLRTKSDLMKSLTRALNSKVPKPPGGGGPVTRSDDSQTPPADHRPPSAGSSTTPKALLKSPTGSESSVAGVTRQDESSSSSLSSFPKPAAVKKSHHHHQAAPLESPDDASSQVRRCKVCENARRPLAFHQLLPGHWSYDNLYLPQVVCPCMQRHLAHLDDVFLPPYASSKPRSRHSWAMSSPDRHPKVKDSSTSSKDNARYSPDGETDSSGSKRQLPERRSLREARSCHCLGCLPEKESRECSCQGHRKMVKFASETDVSRHRHMGVKSDPAALVVGLPRLNGHAAGKGKAGKQEKPPLMPPLMPPFVPRGMKEPIKMEELYGAYPINFRDWESHYRRNFLRKRKKRALAMVGMAIGIVMVVGVAVALTFVFLRIRRPAS